MEKFTIGYKILFTVEVLHHYFLDFGNNAFDTVLLPDQQEVVDLLEKQYDLRRFWQIKPDSITQETLKNYHLVFKESSDGFRIAVEIDNANMPLIPFPTDFKLVFEVYPTDDFFMLYTNISKSVMDDLMRGVDKIIDGKVVRISQVFRLKNTGTLSEQLNPSADIPLSSLEDYQNTEGGKKKPLGYIEISHNPPATALLNGNGTVHEKKDLGLDLVFTIRLDNRKTKWKFGTADLGIHPLVANGRIAVSSGGKQLANPTPSTTFYESGNFVSIIY